MKILPPNTFTKSQAMLAVGAGKSREMIRHSDKEIWTVDEINKLRGLKLDGTDTVIGTGHLQDPYGNYTGLAEDDLVHSYDNNFDEWR